MCERKQKIILAGIGPGSVGMMTEKVRQAVAESDCLIGAQRMLDCVRLLEETEGASSGEKREKAGFAEYDPERILDLIRSGPEYRQITVLFSGDTGFYSGSRNLYRKLREELGGENTDTEIEIIPGISSVSMLAARLGVSWEDAALVSMHGRDAELVHTVSRNRKTFVLLGGKDAGRHLLMRLREFRMDQVEICAGLRLSCPDEKILCGAPNQLDDADLDGLCVVLIRNPDPLNSRGMHLPDRAFIRGKVPMTKEAVRAVSIAKLRLTEDAVVYDIGAGTGSVSVEAALSCRRIRVYAVEQKEEALELIDRNRKKFRTDAVYPVAGRAPEILSELEKPTHVFVGGSGGKLKEILRAVFRKNPKVRIVINAVSLETLREAMEAAEEGLLPHPEITQITAADSRLLGGYHMMTGQNPVYIISDGAEEEEL